MNKTTFLTSIALSAASLAHAALVIDFNNSGDLTGNFTRTGSTLWAETASGGNPSGYASVGSNFSGFNTQNSTFSLDLSQDQSFTLSADILTAFNLFPRDGYLNLSLGLTTASSIAYAGSGNLDQVSLVAGTVSKTDNIDGSTGGPTNTYGYHFGRGDTSTGRQITGSSVDNLSINTWYQLITNWTYTDSTNTFAMNLVLKSADGTSTVRDLSFASGIANPWGADDTIIVHAFFGGRESYNAGISGVDNFTTPVPEPSAFALLGGLCALG
ncbi:MAG: hypothetical protein ACP5I4_16760, partial [Oceanipulchritudo sp.]